MNPWQPVRNPAILMAAGDLRRLLERGYPKKASVKLVGDRHRLDSADRQILYRGVVPPTDALRRRRLLIRSGAVDAADLGIDGHNVVLTLANYLSGIPVFLADDGVVRDIGALHGRLHDEAVMFRCLDLVADAVAGLAPGQVFAVFDEPLSHSRDHAGRFRDRLTGLLGDDRCRVEVASSGDEALKAVSPGIAATSDSAVIDALDRPIFDLPRYILEAEFGAVFSGLEVVPEVHPG